MYSWTYRVTPEDWDWSKVYSRLAVLSLLYISRLLCSDSSNLLVISFTTRFSRSISCPKIIKRFSYSAICLSYLTPSFLGSLLISCCSNELYLSCQAWIYRVIYSFACLIRLFYKSSLCTYCSYWLRKECSSVWEDMLLCWLNFMYSSYTYCCLLLRRASNLASTLDISMDICSFYRLSRTFSSSKLLYCSSSFSYFDLTLSSTYNLLV